MLFLSRNMIFFIILGMVAGMLCIGLYPFNYSPPNEASILKDGSGIRFYGRGEAVSVGDTAWPRAGYSGQPFTLELHLRPLRAYHQGVPHILSLCDGSGREIFYLGQWKNHLVMRLLGDNRWITRVEKERGTPDFLNVGQLVFLSFVFNAGRVELYANGTLAEVYDGLDLNGTIVHRPVRSIILGNSSLGTRPWQGEIHGFSVYDKALDPIAIQDNYHRRGSDGKGSVTGEIISYQFDRPSGETFDNLAGSNWDLVIPDTLTPIRREFLSLPLPDTFTKRWFYTDALLNLVGFIPLGFFLAVLLRARKFPGIFRTIALSFATGFLLSLFIEANQAFLVTRTSSITDLGLNSMGTMIGTMAFLALSRATPSRFSG